MLNRIKMHLLLFLLVVCFQFQAHGESKTVLITGGAGFMGSNFVKYMFDKYPDYQLIVLDALTYASTTEGIPEEIRTSPRFYFVHGSICDKTLVNKLMDRCDFVVHFAAETDVTRSITNDEVFFETNVMGTRNLLHSLVKHKDKVQRFIHISSSEVYGTCEGDEIHEEHPLNARSPYAASKIGAERAVYAYGCTYNSPVVIMRFFNNYGPNQHLEKVVPKFISHALHNLPITIHGSGEQSRDWVYVMDTARAIDAALHIENFERIRNSVINCGTGRDTSITEIATIICHLAGSSTDNLIFTPDRPGQVFKHLSSTQKAKELLGWEAQTTLEEGLRSTVNWYKAHTAFWEPELSNPQIHKSNDALIPEKVQSK